MRRINYRTFAPIRLNPLVRRRYASIFGEYKMPDARPAPIAMSADRALLLEWNRQARVIAAISKQSNSAEPELASTIRIAEVDPRYWTRF